ncbi:MAG: hypothetical protein LBG61_02630, partial [Burkholderiales bacterium]|nr:hypothetical protein [Burkholderiales bacterium]
MRAFILCVFLLTGMNAVAADALTQIESRLKKPERVCGAFAQKKVMAHLDAPAQSQGRFCVDKNEGILWRITRPYSSAVKING